MKKVKLMIALAAIAGVASAAIIWEDDAPGGGNGETIANAMTCNAIADPTGSGMGTVGEIVFDTADEWVSIAPATADQLIGQDGVDINYTFDVYIPSTSAAVGSTAVVFPQLASSWNNFGQWLTLDNELIFAKDTWVTISGSGTIAAADTTPLLVWNNPGGTVQGTAMYVDNIQFETVPEPATLGMVAIFGAAGLFIRRRMMI